MRILGVLLACMLCVAMLVSCDNTTTFENESLLEVESTADDGEYAFVINTATKKYHIPSCRYAISMSEESREVTSDIAFIYERGYSPCGSCIAR